MSDKIMAVAALATMISSFAVVAVFVSATDLIVVVMILVSLMAIDDF